ncbi:helix-turn-helix transcriptional regulator [Streptomyces sp. NBC_01142]|uniref:helix-turn-helix domain-containing protein n=1 Tax=Streptomyces sp. NBC_01142 TaxID=2975865 RepID=UPI002B1D4E4F|nr:helix-turn-helix transcriptional regulator [Streptomyces sp. NBC_01142]
MIPSRADCHCSCTWGDRAPLRSVSGSHRQLLRAGRESAMPAAKDLGPCTSPRSFYGAELRSLREEAGLSQEQLGERGLCSGAYSGLFEAATRRPQADMWRSFWTGSPGRATTLSGSRRGMQLPSALRRLVYENPCRRAPVPAHRPIGDLIPAGGVGREFMVAGYAQQTRAAIAAATDSGSRPCRPGHVAGSLATHRH